MSLGIVEDEQKAPRFAECFSASVFGDSRPITNAAYGLSRNGRYPGEWIHLPSFVDPIRYRVIDLLPASWHVISVNEGRLSPSKRLVWPIASSRRG